MKGVSGAGSLWAIEIDPLKIKTLIPIAIYDYRFAQKLATALVIEKLYSNYSILSFFGSNNKIKLIISLPLIANNKDLEIIFEALEDVFISNKGLNSLFIKKAIEEIKNKFKINNN